MVGIGSKLRKRRLELGLSRNQLAEKIHVTPSAVANYENGISYPKPEILISLITVLAVDANYFYQDYLSNIKLRTLYGQELTAEETESVAKYKLLTPQGKQLVHALIAEEYNRAHIDEWIEFPCFCPGSRKQHSGFSQTDSSPKVRLKRKHAVKGMEFCFQIQVDHYQPVFQKGDILALQQAPAAHNEMGIFCLNGVYYIRSLYHAGNVCRLRALNVIEPDIEVLESDDFICVGKILGKIYGTCELIGSFTAASSAQSASFAGPRSAP